jgi:DNA polymerase-1
MSCDTTLIIDASNLVHRAYHATAAREDKESSVVSVLTLMNRMLHNLLREVGDARLIAAFDNGKTFRHEIFPAYKLNRKEKPKALDHLMKQVPDWLSRHFDTENLFSPGYEADDVIAAICDQMLPYGHRLAIVSNDKDLLQLVSGDGPGPGACILQYDKGMYRAVGEKNVLEKMGVPPHRVAILKALMGDMGDGYVGIPKIGPVAGKQIASLYGSPRQIWEALPKIQASSRKAIEAAGMDHLLLMDKLARLDHRAPLRNALISTSA